MGFPLQYSPLVATIQFGGQGPFEYTNEKDE